MLKNKLREFFLTNKTFRKSRNFINQNIFPILVKSILLIFVLSVFSIIAVKIFKPEYFNKIHRELSYRFYEYLDKKEYSKVNLYGNKRILKADIVKIVKATKARTRSLNNQSLIQNLIDDLKEELAWINKITINRSIPDTLNIIIEEYEPFAIWYDEEKSYVIDRDGNRVLADDLEEFRYLVVLSGSGANIKARSLFNIFAINPILSSNIYSATWVGNRRWDIRFDSGLLVKMPEKNISNAWQSLIKIYNLPGSIVGLKVIDLRIDNKIYLEYNDSVIKELKTL